MFPFEVPFENKICVNYKPNFQKNQDIPFEQMCIVNVNSLVKVCFLRD